jgi:DNA-binding MarR family transcriptional regulator
MENIITKHSTVVMYNREREEAFKRGQVNTLKKAQLAKIEELLASQGLGMDNLTEAEYRIMNYITYNTCVTGVQAIGLDTIINRTGYKKTTVWRARVKLEKLGILEVGYLGNGQKGHYVFVLKTHKNYAEIMEKVFGIYPQAEVVEKEANETSYETSNETSSKAETPCGSKEEGAEKVSTISSIISLDKKEINNNQLESFDVQDNQRAKVYMSEKQVTMFHTIKAGDWIKPIKDNASKIVLRTGFEFEPIHVMRALKMMEEGIILFNEPVDSAPGLFEYYYNNVKANAMKKEQQKPSQVDQMKSKQSGFKRPNYNWLEN